MATSAIPHATLHKILWRQIDPKNVEHRKKIARFYLQCERYEDARQVLKDIVAGFPRADRHQAAIGADHPALRQLGAERLLAELKLRRAAGQHQLVQALLKKFPSEDVPGEILQAVREMIQQYEAAETPPRHDRQGNRGAWWRSSRRPRRQDAAKLQKEIAAELNIDTLPRMAAFLQNLERPANEGRGQAGPGPERLAAGGRPRDAGALHGPVGLPRPRAGAAVPDRGHKLRRGKRAPVAALRGEPRRRPTWPTCWRK